MALRWGRSYWGSAGWALLLLPLSVQCQSGTPPAPATAHDAPAFRTSVHNVVVDVVVTDRDGSPRKGLCEDDFEVREQGVPQKILSFEEHSGTLPPNQVPPLPLPSDVFSNEVFAPPETLTVLLLDSLNTSLADQAYVNAQTTKYLKSLPPGTRMAIFTLSDQSNLVLGFTSDASQLSAALNGKAALPQAAGLLNADRSKADATQAGTTSPYQGQSSSGSDPAVAGAVKALQRFQAENESSQGIANEDVTLKALQQPARYLSAVPGRKNVVWFAGSFPGGIGTSGEAFDSNELYRPTINMLVEARVSLYPVRASGIPGNSLYDASTQMTGVQGPSSAQAYQNNSLVLDSKRRATYQGLADATAGETGGQAIYGTNDLGGAMGKAIRNGSHYYTLTYSPTDKRTDGRYRPIRVKLLHGRNALQYRRGYFADDDSAKKAAMDRTVGPNDLNDPLVPLMQAGLPGATQVLFKVKVRPAGPSTQDATLASGKRARELTHYTADFAVAMDGVHLDLTPDGLHRGELELMLVAFDRTGNALNVAKETVHLALRPEYFADYKESGIQVHEEIDVPRGASTLRVGVFDANTDRAGVMDVPLGQVVAQAALAPR